MLKEHYKLCQGYINADIESDFHPVILDKPVAYNWSGFSSGFCWTLTVIKLACLSGIDMFPGLEHSPTTEESNTDDSIPRAAYSRSRPFLVGCQ